MSGESKLKRASDVSILLAVDRGSRGLCLWHPIRRCQYMATPEGNTVSVSDTNLTPVAPPIGKRRGTRVEEKDTLREQMVLEL